MGFCIFTNFFNTPLPPLSAVLVRSLPLSFFSVTCGKCGKRGVGAAAGAAGAPGAPGGGHWDLRAGRLSWSRGGHPGGPVDSARELPNPILRPQPVVSSRGKNGHEDTVFASGFR